MLCSSTSASSHSTIIIMIIVKARQGQSYRFHYCGFSPFQRPPPLHPLCHFQFAANQTDNDNKSSCQYNWTYLCNHGECHPPCEILNILDPPTGSQKQTAPTRKNVKLNIKLTWRNFSLGQGVCFVCSLSRVHIKWTYHSDRTYPLTARPSSIRRVLSSCLYIWRQCVQWIYFPPLA